MAVKWTKEQQQVIDTRDRNILVSAAAGSGKTAVLVARILKRITEEKSVDIDRLLVVTFTNAAAGEMRERIRDALELRAQEEPDNEDLQRQLVLVHNAKITTIHSFCLNVLRSHFQTVGIDPSFRIADEGETMLLEQDTVKETVNEAYEWYTDPEKEAGSEEARKEFAEFLESFAAGKSDKIIEELILQVYHFSLGQPWPSAWLRECRQKYDPDVHPNWLDFIVQDTKNRLADLQKLAERSIWLANDIDGPHAYLPALQSDLEKLEILSKAGDYKEFAERFWDMEGFARLSIKKEEGVSLEKKEMIQQLRSMVKDGLGEIKERYFFGEQGRLMQEFWKSGTCVRVLTDLTERFSVCIAKKKAEKNVVDFGDLEHLALRVLVDEETGEPTAAAREYAELFEEIMTDEYQDSNLVQELILNSVSGKGQNRPNRFMVGDVKQSIYRFRLARPELFMEKYRTYREDPARACRIDLHQNFRSRSEVLESVNHVFRKIMTEYPGGIRYDADAALYPGAVFEERPEKEDGAEHTSLNTEVVLLEADTQTRQKAEAQLIGRRILEMVGKEYVWDKEEGQYRTVRFRDIVILLRTVSGWAETFGEVLGDMGIPCFTGSQKGYFSAQEIRTVLAYLNILDNPMQDIPLAAVLHSPIGDFQEEELAQIRIFSRESHFYECCQSYRKEGPKEALRKKLERFFTTFEHLRAKCAHTPMHQLLWEILDETGYGDYAAALPGGAQRKANLDMLAEKAVAYEATSYRGLYHFVRYIENLKKYEVDYGEANLDSEAADTVRLMSIHKSKGLEFPVVFVGGMGKAFNETDIRRRVVVHPDLGIACDYVDLEKRVRSATLLKRTIQQKTKLENLGEEMRVLYVAMTRAKEKLILVGSAADRTRALQKWERDADPEAQTLTYSCLTGASCYFDWVMPCILDPMEQDGFSLQFPDQEKEAETERKKQAEEKERAKRLLELPTEHCFDREADAYLQSVFAWKYPYETDWEIPGKLSVSELKKMSAAPEESDCAFLYQAEPVVPLIPRFRQEEEPIVGAQRGTIFHKFMEFYDFSRPDELELQLEEQITCGKMSREEGESIRLLEIRRFLRTRTGAKMAAAAQRGELFREKPFVLGVSADTIHSSWSAEETVLIQGIIDAYYLDEDGQIVIVDYKTDRVTAAEELVVKYRTQLEYYAAALKRLTGRTIRSLVIYSFCLGKEIFI